MARPFRIEYETPIKNISASTILGNRNFINEVRTKYIEGKEFDRNLPDASHFYNKPDVDEIIENVKQVITEDSALIKRVQIYLCHRYSGQKLKDIGIHFGIDESAVSQASRRVTIQVTKIKR